MSLRVIVTDIHINSKLTKLIINQLKSLKVMMQMMNFASFGSPNNNKFSKIKYKKVVEKPEELQFITN